MKTIEECALNGDCEKCLKQGECSARFRTSVMGEIDLGMLECPGFKQKEEPKEDQVSGEKAYQLRQEGIDQYHKDLKGRLEEIAKEATEEYKKFLDRDFILELSKNMSANDIINLKNAGLI